MNNQLISFRWRVPANGYKWLEATGADIESRSGIYLTDGFAINSGYGKEYSPLDSYPELFRNFADTEPTQEGIIKFANKYGRLGTNGQLITLGNKKKNPLFAGEIQAVWEREILNMRHYIRLWDMIKNSDNKSLSDFIIQDNNGVKYQSHTGSHLIANTNYHPERLKLFSPNDLTLPARYLLQKIFNDTIKNKASPRFLWEKDELSLFIVPDSLLSAMWLQFALAFHGNKKYQRCSTCKSWFELTSKIENRDPKYCSDACKSKAYRLRKKMEVMK